MRKKSLPYTKTVRTKGNVYVYFDTGEKRNGKKVFKALPSKSDPSFGSTYSAMLGHRTRRKVGYLTVAKLVTLFYESARFNDKAENTQKLYRTYLDRFASQLPTAPAAKLERTDVMAIMDRMADKPGAAKMMRASIAALYSWARKRGHVDNRPADDIEVEKGGEHDPWPQELVNLALESENDTIRLAVHLLYYTAQRISDVAAMRWAQIGSDTMTVIQQKTGKEIEIALHASLASELSRRSKDLRTLLVNKKGRSFNDQTLRYALQSWAKGKGFHVVPHGLRKNAINSLLEVGCSVAQAASISGQSLQMVERYARKRDQTKLSRQAMKLWEGTEDESSNRSQL